MASLLKYSYNQEYLASLAQRVWQVEPTFDQAEFLGKVFDEQWSHRELKDRMHHIRSCLYYTLRKPYKQALEVLMPVSVHFSGFESMFFPDFVEYYGLEHWDASMQALEHFTCYGSSEFAVRPFIQRDPQKMMAQMRVWARSENHHVRRLASEGCRPRLPWAMALDEFKRDPQLIIPILEQLNEDESDYVRRSVANNMNDISKDHPQKIISLANQWLGINPKTDWVVRHGCRTLLKKGNRDVLALFGFLGPEHICIEEFTVSPIVCMGGALEFSLVVERILNHQEHSVPSLGRIRLEYDIGFIKKNGTRSYKRFHLCQGDYQERKKRIRKTHSFKKISTRTYYPGTHSLEVIVNGERLASVEFELTSEAP